ncbi:cytochrome P450 [Suillus decipiens]|nr:cytochrome P450 [Suillus decipiens]
MISQQIPCCIKHNDKVSRALRWRFSTAGPPRTSFIYGVSHNLALSQGSGGMYERQAIEYGVAYMIPSILGQTKISGRGLLLVHGEAHALRKALTLAFSNVAIRKLISAFYDSTYKIKICDAKGTWDTIIESSKDAEPDESRIVRENILPLTPRTDNISLDTVGIAGFSHDFSSLDGKHTSVTEASAVNQFLRLLAPAFPIIAKILTKRRKLITQLSATVGEIFNDLLIRNCREKDWALIELSRHSNVQTSPREELVAFGADPTYDQLKANLPYLDAVVHEILRLHPPLATADDVILLSESVRTESGEMTDSISIAKGTLVTISSAAINRSSANWGPDAKPDRWLTEDGKAKEIQGHRHLLTFIDGPRTCPGKDFAVAEFKTVLFVLVKSFVFEMRDGPETL